MPVSGTPGSAVITIRSVRVGVGVPVIGLHGLGPERLGSDRGGALADGMGVTGGGNPAVRLTGRSLASCHQGTQAPGAFRRPKLPQGFRLDLANPFAGDVELLADLLECVFPLATNAKAHPDHLLFLRR
jgi:hypothetical protein